MTIGYMSLKLGSSPISTTGRKHFSGSRSKRLTPSVTPLSRGPLVLQVVTLQFQLGWAQGTSARAGRRVQETSYIYIYILLLLIIIIIIITTINNNQKIHTCPFHYFFRGLVEEKGMPVTDPDIFLLVPAWSNLLWIVRFISPFGCLEITRVLVHATKSHPRHFHPKLTPKAFASLSQICVLNWLPTFSSHGNFWDDTWENHLV